MLDKLTAIEAKYSQIEARLAAPETYDDPAQVAKLNKEQSELQPLVETFRTYRRTLEARDQARELMSDSEMKELAQEEYDQALKDIPRLEREIQILLLPKDPNDGRGVIMEIRGGVGGEEGALFAASLLRMYTMYAQSRGWKMETVSMNATELGGVKECSVLVEGEGVYSRLKFESGVHRVQRVPETESGGTVKLDGLTKGTKYQLKGWQMLKEENTELIIDGKRVENDYTFIADDEEMKVEISYTFNASALGGKNLVTFEELYDFSNPDEPVKVAEHKDIEDDGQTVLITERIIKIHTTATDKDGNKELEAGKEVTIIDTVTLEGLEVGTQYKLVGWQMLKKENAELLINGKRVESDYTFTADSETMKVEVAFTLDATSLDGKQLVTFEELYDLSNPDDPKKVTEHKDIEDKGQTITFKEKPKEPEKPETPPTPEKPNRPSDSPKTGDNTNLYGLLALLLTSGAGLAGIFFYKRRKMKKS